MFTACMVMNSTPAPPAPWHTTCLPRAVVLEGHGLHFGFESPPDLLLHRRHRGRRHLQKSEFFDLGVFFGLLFLQKPKQETRSPAVAVVHAR